jgi:hypothetical protein
VTCVDADEAGGYAFGALAPGSYLLTAGADGYLPGTPPGSLPIALAAGEAKAHVDIVLHEGAGRIAGVVLDATGGPVHGAIVRVALDGPARGGIAVSTDERGRFRLSVEPGGVSLAAEAQGYAPTRQWVTAPSRDVTLTLTPGSAVLGSVVRTSDGAPMAGIEVRAVPAGAWPSPLFPSGTSGPDGHFSIRGLEPGSYTLAAEGDGWRGSARAPLAVGLATSLDGVTVFMSPAATLEGRVILQKGGTPCEQGSVSLGPLVPGGASPYDPPSDAEETRRSDVPSLVGGVGPDGVVHFRAVPPGLYHVTVQTPSAALAEGPRTIAVGAADVRGLEWKVAPGLGMVVHVTDEADLPIANARFRLLWPPRPPGNSRLTMPLAVDAKGQYVVPSVLYPGVYTLLPDGGYGGSPLDVELRQGMGNVDVALRVQGRSAIVALVQTPEGAPIDDVTVTARGLTSAPDAGATGAEPSTLTAVALGDGLFRLGPLAAGRYEVRVSDGVNAPVSVGDASGSFVDVGTANTVRTQITLHRNATLRGRVLDGNGEPVPDVWVSASCRPTGAPADSTRQPPLPADRARRSVSAADGTFVLARVEPGATCTVLADQPLGSAATVSDVPAGSSDLRVVLQASGSLAGIVSEDGRPVALLHLTVQERATGRAFSSTFDATGGRWSLAHVAPGDVEIFASDEQGAMAHQKASLAPGQSLAGLQLDLRSPAAPELSPTTLPY